VWELGFIRFGVQGMDGRGQPLEFIRFGVQWEGSTTGVYKVWGSVGGVNHCSL
jgi:hypothetical protein